MGGPEAQVLASLGGAAAVEAAPAVPLQSFPLLPPSCARISDCFGQMSLALHVRVS